MTDVSNFRHLERRQILVIAGLLVMLAGGWAILRGGSAGNTAPAPVPAAAVTPAPRPPIADELMEATRALGATQQQAVDQLQVMQDLLTAQRAETKRLSTEIEALNAKVSALQEAVANIPTAAGSTSAQQSKAPPAKSGR